MLLLITSLLVFRRNPDSCTTLTEINLFNSMSWYVGYYFLVMLLARLFLNRYLEKLERKQYRLFLFALLCMTQFKRIIKAAKRRDGESGDPGYRRSLLPGRLHSAVSALCPGADLGDFRGDCGDLHAAVPVHLRRGARPRIQDYYREASTDPFIQYIPNVGDNSIVAILLGLSLFELFRRIKMPCCRGINYLGAGPHS